MAFNIFEFLEFLLNCIFSYKKVFPVFDQISWSCKKNEGSIHSQCVTYGDPLPHR